MTTKIAQDLVEKCLKKGADEVEVYLSNERDVEIDVRRGNVETIKHATSKGLGLTIFKDKHLGFTYTSDFSKNSLDEIVEKTFELCSITDPKEWNGLPEFTSKKTVDLDLFDPSLEQMTNEKKIALATEVEKIALNYDKRITNTQSGSFSDWLHEIIIVNSKGVAHHVKMTGCYLGVGVLAGETDAMQSGFWGCVKRHLKDLETPQLIAETAAQKAIEMLGAKPVKTQKVPVIIDRYAAGAFWQGIIWALDGNSAFKNTTFLADSLNRKIASDLITIVDEPTIPRYYYSSPFDGEGKVTQKNTLIDAGTLKMFIYNTITARKAKVETETITKRHSYKSTPFASPLNVVVQNGTTKREKMIKDVKDGFYVKDFRGIGTDPTTGNFSTGASGFWIKDGELAFPVDGVTLGGDTIDLLNKIELVADDLEMIYSVNSPTFKISEITVGGL